MTNPVIKKLTTLSMRVSGTYQGECMLTDEDGNEIDLMALLEMFRDKDIKINVKSTEDEE